MLARLSVLDMCMLEKQWHKFFNKPSPHTPAKYTSYNLLNIVTSCKRASTALSERLEMKCMISHITALASLDWKYYSSSKAMKEPLALFKKQISDLRCLLIDKKLDMVGHNTVRSQKTPHEQFRTLPSYVKLDEANQEFYVSILPPTKRSKSRGMDTAKSAAIKQCINALKTTLIHAEDYHVFHLTDEQMGVVDSATIAEGGVDSLDSIDRTYLRRKFKEKLSEGIDGMCINLFGRDRPGCVTPSCLFIWKAPIVQRDIHAGNVQLAIEQCRELIPKKISAESAKRFNNIMRTEKERANARKRVVVLTDRLFALTMKEVATAMLPGADDAVVGEVSLIIISWIGIDTKVIELNHVSADIELEDGQSQTTSQAIAKSAIKSKLAEARKVVSRDFRSAYDESVKQPIDAINERLSKLVVSGKPVSVTPRVQSSVEEDLHSILSKIDNKYDQSYRNAEDAKKMPTMSIWMKKHALILPYSISIQKCNDVSCCGELRSPVAFRNLVMQRQPTPRMDTSNTQRKKIISYRVMMLYVCLQTTPVRYLI